MLHDLASIPSHDCESSSPPIWQKYSFHLNLGKTFSNECELTGHHIMTSNNCINKWVIKSRETLEKGDKQNQVLLRHFTTFLIIYLMFYHLISCISFCLLKSEIRFLRGYPSSLIHEEVLKRSETLKIKESLT